MKLERLAYLMVIAFLVGGMSWLVVRQTSAKTESAEASGAAGDATQAQTGEDEYVGVASPDFSPREVTERQVAALRDAASEPERIRECFALAAPSNREQTGPVERFAEMVMQEPYRTLVVAPQCTIGEAIVEGRLAAVLVTAAETDQEPRVFRFVLEKQQTPPYQDCWMTVAVQSVELVETDQ